MSADAIVMMVIAMLLLWGGLAAAVVSLNRRPDADEAHDAEVPHRER